MRELPTSEMDEISQASGTVQFSYISYPIEILNVWWDEVVHGQDAEVILKHAFDSMSADKQLAFLPGEAAKVWVDDKELDRKSTRLNSSHMSESRMPSSA